MIIIKNIVHKNFVFKSTIEGGQKLNFFLFDEMIVLNQTHEENLEIFFLSKFFRYLNLPVFKTYLAKDVKNNLVVLMNDFYSNTNNIQFRYVDSNDFLNLSYLFYLNIDIMKKYYQRLIHLVILDNYDNTSKVNMFFNKDNDIYYIDINNISGRTANFYFLQSFENNSFMYLGNIYNYNLNNEFFKIIKSNNNYLFKIYNNNNPFMNDIFLKDKFDISPEKFNRLTISEAIKLINNKFVVNENQGTLDYERYNLVVKHFMIKILSNYYHNYGNKTVEDFLIYIRTKYNDEVSAELLNIQRQATVEIIKNILLIDDIDISYITLDYNPKLLLGVTNNEIQNFKDYIKDKQLELFYYGSKYEFLHKILNKCPYEELTIQKHYNVSDLKYFDINAINSINILEENQVMKNYATTKIVKNNFKACISKNENNGEFCITELRQLSEFFAYKFESQEFKNTLKPKLLEFQKELRKEFNKKSLPSWTEKSYNQILYGYINKEYTIYDTIGSKTNINCNENSKTEMHKVMKNNSNINNIIDFQTVKQSDIYLKTEQEDALFIKSNILLSSSGLILFIFCIILKYVKKQNKNR